MRPRFFPRLRASFVARVNDEGPSGVRRSWGLLHWPLLPRSETAALSVELTGRRLEGARTEVSGRGCRTQVLEECDLQKPRARMQKGDVVSLKSGGPPCWYWRWPARRFWSRRTLRVQHVSCPRDGRLVDA